jgi:predicted transposase YbfD/YdcC
MNTGSVIAADGKTVRGSESGERKAIHIVSARADGTGLVPGQAQAEGKPNEITAVPALPEALDISGCIVTIDATGCQKAATQTIVSKHGGCTLALKENRPEVYEEARELFEGIGEPPGSFPSYTDATKDHGRIEKREARLCTDLSWFAGLAARAGLVAVGCIRSTRTAQGIVTREIRYYLTTLADAGGFARPARSHWGIGNKPHGVLDAAFREDYARNRKDHPAASLAILRKITLNLLRLEPTEKYRKRKLSLNRKRLCASCEPEFLFKFLFNL